MLNLNNLVMIQLQKDELLVVVCSHHLATR